MTTNVRDTVKADGRFDRQVIRAMARRLADAEIATTEQLMQRGRLRPGPIDKRAEFRSALKRTFLSAKYAWTAHPANTAKVKMVMATPQGRQRDGVRRSAF